MILLNDILKLSLSDLENTKVRFNIANVAGDPLFLFKNDRNQLQTWQFWNYKNITNLTKERKAILHLLGPFCQKYYLLL